MDYDSFICETIRLEYRYLNGVVRTQEHRVWNKERFLVARVKEGRDSKPPFEVKIKHD